jgi:hypothetical protein
VKAFAALLAFCAALPAYGYVQTRTPSGTPIHWQQSCVVMTPDSRGDSLDAALDIATINATLKKATENWNNTDGSCTFFRLGETDAYAHQSIHKDETPSIVFVTEGWPDDEQTAIALTQVWFTITPGQPTDGFIFDADTALNAQYFTFTTTPENATARTGTGVADLENTLTHELGHVQGLGHTCWNEGSALEPTDPIDNTGNAIAACVPGAPPPPGAATMYPFAGDTYPEDIRQRTVQPDDTAGICDNYPSTAPATACYAYVKEGCAVVSGQQHWFSALLVLAYLAWRWRVLARRRPARVYRRP